MKYTPPSTDFFQLVAEGRQYGHSSVNKFGRNADLDAGTEDVWNGGGTYTGFPVGAPEEVELFSDNAGDTGMVTFTYLASSASTAWQTATVQLNGLTPVPSGITAWRIHTAQYASGSATGFNLGTITCRHRVTTANVFFAMPVGRSQTNVCAYTIPAGHTGYIWRLFGQVKGSTTAQVDFDLWARTLNGSPRLRRPNSAVNADKVQVQLHFPLIVPAGSDIKMQATTTSNNLDVIAGFDLLLKRNED